jgi:hypothetical protein
VTRWVLIALVGLGLAAGISVGASRLGSQPVGLSSEPLTAGDQLAPAAARAPARPARRRAPATTTTATPAPTTAAPPPTTAPTPAPTVTEPDRDDHRGHGSGGDDGDRDDD